MVEKTKRIGNYEIKFKTSIDEATGDCVNMKIVYTQDLLELMKTICVTNEDPVDLKFRAGVDIDGSNIYETYKRYKVKRVVFSSISGEYKEIAFIKELIDSGETTIRILDVHKVEEIILGFKYVIAEAVKVMTKYADLDATVKFNVNVREN
jgi:hypothetical protein